MAQQKVRFCNSADGTRIAFAITGDGPAVLRGPHWLTHIEYDWKVAFRRNWIEELSRHYTLVRFDPRGCGLSARDPDDIALDRFVEDLEAVADAAGLDRFPIIGPSQGGAVAIEFAARHPERVSQLVLVGAFALGKLKRDNPASIENAMAQLRLVELGWGSDDPAYRQVFASQMMPTGSPEAVASLTEMMRLCASPTYAARLIRMYYEIDVRAAAARVRCPTLVLHSRGDRRVPYEEGVALAGLIPGARFATIESINHLVPSDDPAWPAFFAQIYAFLPSARPQKFGELSAREAEVLERLANGLDNADIAIALGMSEKTVRNHLTRIFEKIGARHRGEAIVRARQAGYGIE